MFISFFVIKMKEQIWQMLTMCKKISIHLIGDNSIPGNNCHGQTSS